MSYTFRLFEDKNKRDFLSRQLLQAEADLYVHSTNAALIEAAGKDPTEELELAEVAQAIAELAGAMLDELPPEESEEPAVGGASEVTP